MRQPPKAQVSVEYMAIVTLIMIGVLAGGPTLIRSINAYFQNLNQGVADSLRERINEVPVYPMPPCVCTDVTGNCGSLKKACDGKRECCEYEREWDAINCAPPSCNLIDRRHCRFDDTCCTEEKLNCGPLSKVGDKGPGNAVGGNFDLLTPNSCRDGYRMWFRECGAAKKEYHCDRDSSCDFRCFGAKDANSTWCPNYNTRLPSDLTTYMVSACGNRNANGKCEATCNPIFVPDPTGGSCICPPGSSLIGGVCVYPPPCVNFTLVTAMCSPCGRGWNCQTATVVDARIHKDHLYVVEQVNYYNHGWYWSYAISGHSRVEDVYTSAMHCIHQGATPVYFTFYCSAADLVASMTLELKWINLTGGFWELLAYYNGAFGGYGSGYFWDQWLAKFFGGDINNFKIWFCGQTGALCPLPVCPNCPAPWWDPSACVCPQPGVCDCP